MKARLFRIFIGLSLCVMAWQNYQGRQEINRLRDQVAEEQFGVSIASAMATDAEKRAAFNEAEADYAIGMAWHLATKASLERFRAERCEYLRDGSI